MRPLYIEARRHRTVSLEGPALRIDEPQTAPRTYPLARLDRVVCRGTPRWKTNALTACMEAGVPVTFLTRGGRVVGTCFGQRVRDLGLTEQLWSFLAHGEGCDALRDWVRAQERREILEAHAKSGVAPSPAPRDIPTWQCVRDELNAQGSHAAAIRDALIGLTRAHVHAHLARRVSPAFLGRHPSCPDLGEDVLAIARWRIVPHVPSMIRHYERHQNKLANPNAFQAWTVRQYEAVSPSIEKLLSQLTSDLEFWLARFTDMGIDGP